MIGGNFALDLANTVDAPGLPDEFDHLGRPGTALAWGEQVGLLDGPARTVLAHSADNAPDRAAADLRRLSQLRSAVQAVFGAVAEDAALPEAALAHLRRSAGEAVAAARLVLDGDRVRPVWDLDDLGALSGPVAYAALDLLTRGPLDMVKRCAACPWLYLDRSRNGSRRWCSMEDCGKAAKMDRYVAKRAAGRR